MLRFLFDDKRHRVANKMIMSVVGVSLFVFPLMKEGENDDDEEKLYIYSF